MKKITTFWMTLILILTLTACSGGKVAVITLGDTITVAGSGATANRSTVTITAGGTYSISGELTNGQVEVNTKEKVKIKLNGVKITNNSGPALLITDAKKVTVMLVAGATNYLTDGNSKNKNDAAIFTNDTLVIEGDGILIVTGNNREGISRDDDIIINGGTIKITAPDDGLNAHDDITFNGGYVYIIAGGDGIDSNGTTNLTGGTVISLGSTAEGDGGVDSIRGFTITGGTLIATGNINAAPDIGSTQSSFYIDSGSNLAAGTLFHVEQDGSDIVTFAPARSYQTVLYSSEKLTEGTTYQAYMGGSSSGTATDGLYTDGTYTEGAGNTSISVTAAIVPAGLGETGGPGGNRP